MTQSMMNHPTVPARRTDLFRGVNTCNSSTVSPLTNDITMIRMQYEFLNKRFDGLEKNIEAATNKSDRKFEAMSSEINRRFEAMDWKLTTWFLGLMGLIVVEGGFDFFSDKNRAGNSK